MNVRTLLISMMMVSQASSLAMAGLVRTDQLENDSVDVVIPLSQNKIEAEVEHEQVQRDRENKPKTSLEAGISTWIPVELNTPSRLANPSAYMSNGVPTININVMSPLGTEFNLKFGAGALLMHRFADLYAVGQITSQEETASLVSGRLGIEYLPTVISTPVFRPYLSASALPTMVLTNRTALDAGNTYFGVLGQLSAGSLIAFTKTFGLNVGITQTLGRVNDSDVSGFGVDAMVRLPL